MAKNTSISLGDYFDRFVEMQLNSGRYKNASEVIRAALRLLEKEEDKHEALKKAIEAGIASGNNPDFNPDSHLNQLKKKNN